jgi:hypothetical protein
MLSCGWSRDPPAKPWRNCCAWLGWLPSGRAHASAGALWLQEPCRSLTLTRCELNETPIRSSRAEAVPLRVALRDALERLMVRLRREQPRHRSAIDELLADVEAAFTGPAFWATFLKRAHSAGIRRVSEWLNTTGVGRRGAVRAGRAPLAGLSTSPGDAFLNPIRVSIKPCAYG